MGIKAKNQEKILRMLRCHGSLKISSVMKTLALSEASVRRYFADMERAGLIFRYHGGIRLIVEKGQSGYHFNDAVSAFASSKHQIGVRASQLITEHDRLFFDSGTTVMECGSALAERSGSDPLNDLRIVSNSLAFASNFTPFCPVILTGGMIRSARQDLCGTVALETVRRYHFTKAFMGTDAISEQGVLSTTDEDTSNLAAAVLEHSNETFILADSSKLGKTSFVPYATLHDSRITLITDQQADPQILQKFQDAGVKIIIAGGE